MRSGSPGNMQKLLPRTKGLLLRSVDMVLGCSRVGLRKVRGNCQLPLNT
jgi:hypothetical protein